MKFLWPVLASHAAMPQLSGIHPTLCAHLIGWLGAQGWSGCGWGWEMGTFNALKLGMSLIIMFGCNCPLWVQIWWTCLQVAGMSTKFELTSGNVIELTPRKVTNVSIFSMRWVIYTHFSKPLAEHCWTFFGTTLGWGLHTLDISWSPIESQSGS